MRIGKWTLREWVQGIPFGHPTHPMLVHFPTALYPAALFLGVMSRVQAEPVYGQAATFLLLVGIATSVLAAFTGLVDWWGMVPGSTKRRAATRHMLVQITSQSVAIAALVFHLIDLGVVSVTAIATLAVSTILLFAGNWFGGILVYRMGMRVSGGTSEASPTRAEAA